VAWYRADLGITIATGVSAWADQSATGDANKNLTQVVAGRQFTYSTSDAALGNAASIQGGATKSIQSGAWGASLSQPLTILWSGIASTTAEQIVVQTGGALFVESTPATATCTANAGLNLVGTGTNLTAKHVGAVEFNGASSAIYVNSRTAANSGATGAGTVPNIFVGNVSDGGALPWLGSLHELVFINRILSASELAKLMIYMGARIGQAIL
jgi:hypothetical protein